MEKEQAIEIIETHSDDISSSSLLGRALNMAIDALKAQLPKGGTTSDLISRQAAIDALDCINGTEEVLRSLPPAQHEPHEGYWIDKGWDGDWAWQIDGRGNCWRVIECSECGKRVLVESNYCPHCGDKKKGAEHETDDADVAIEELTDRSHQAAKRVGTDSPFWEGLVIARRIVNNLPTIQPEPQWIPVSERLPEDRQYVLLTVRRLNNAYNSTPFISVGYIGWNQHHWWCAHDGDCEISEVEVLAWMPLPELYKPNK